MIFKAADIRWIKNVKHPNGEFLTYMDEYPDGSFDLHWSKRFKNADQALKPKIGDVIVLFQRHKGITYLTHLVTPVDDKFVDYRNSTDASYPWGRKVTIVARAKNGIMATRQLNFMSVNQNHTYEIDKIKTEFTAQEIRNWIWDAFLPFMELGENLLRTIQIPEDLPEFVAREGEERLKYGLHKYRERDPKLVERKKQESIAQNKLFCECCGFDFAKAYPTHGEGFIECHHKLPISQGERITRLDDLALVCSNCHRMLHKKCEGQYLTIEELKNIIAK